MTDFPPADPAAPYHINTVDGALVVQPRGPMDAASVPLMRPLLKAVVDDGKHPTILDFSEVDFLDSSGIGAIVYLYKRLRAQGRGFAVAALQGQPQHLVEMLRIGRALPLHVSVAKAATALGAVP